MGLGLLPRKPNRFRELGSDWKLLSHVVDNGDDTGAAHSHQYLFQPEGAGAVPRLSAQDQDLLLDRDGVQVVVDLPFRIDAEQLTAPCLPDHRGISLRVLITATGRDKSQEESEFLVKREGNRTGIIKGTQIQGLTNYSHCIFYKGY